MTRMRRALAAVTVVALAAIAPTPALAGVANKGLRGAPSSNPLAGIKWGVYTGAAGGLYPAYQAAHGRNKQLLAKMALRPTSAWWGEWDPDNTIKTTLQQYIVNQTSGNPKVLAQVTVFRLDPWEGQACTELPSAAQQASYKTWINNFAAAIGSSRVALILQPDLPFALCSPGGSTISLQLVAYAAKRFNRLPHTTVYIDAGAAEWEKPSQGASMLSEAGIRWTRGFALNATQYGSTAMELDFGANILSDLAAIGINGKHFVVNTAENGAPFLAGQYPGNPNAPRVCKNRNDHICVTLGIPPTTNTAAAKWGLPAAERSIAAHDADAYLWIGRPWLTLNSSGFDLQRALGVAASTPF
jgi:endoglucanase